MVGVGSSLDKVKKGPTKLYFIKSLINAIISGPFNYGVQSVVDYFKVCVKVMLTMVTVGLLHHQDRGYGPLCDFTGHMFRVSPNFNTTVSIEYQVYQVYSPGFSVWGRKQHILPCWLLHLPEHKHPLSGITVH